MKFPEPKKEPLLDISIRFNKDEREDKIDLGVGVLRDNFCKTPVLDSVKKAEILLNKNQESKSYLGLVGNVNFAESYGKLFLGDYYGNKPQRFMQTAGCTGALFTAFSLLKKGYNNPTIYLPKPAYLNHPEIIKALGINIVEYDFFNRFEQKIDNDALLNALKNAKEEDIFLFQTNCNNPTGANYEEDIWLEAAKIIKEKKITIVIDLAYFGLGKNLQEDTKIANLLAKDAYFSITCLSCSKNFGLYRDRVGLMIIQSDDETLCQHALKTSTSIGRSNISMPPDHGASVVDIILRSEILKDIWLNELGFYRDRIKDIRAKLAKNPKLSFALNHEGMFSMTPLQSHQIEMLEKEFAIYIAPDGRVNIAGLTDGNINKFINAYNIVTG